MTKTVAKLLIKQITRKMRIKKDFGNPHIRRLSNSYLITYGQIDNYKKGIQIIVYDNGNIYCKYYKWDNMLNDITIIKEYSIESEV